MYTSQPEEEHDLEHESLLTALELGYMYSFASFIRHIDRIIATESFREHAQPESRSFIWLRVCAVDSLRAKNERCVESDYISISYLWNARIERDCGRSATRNWSVRKNPFLCLHELFVPITNF